MRNELYACIAKRNNKLIMTDFIDVKNYTIGYQTDSSSKMKKCTIKEENENIDIV